MPDNDKSPPKVPESKTVPKKRTRLSFVWVIPIVAAAAGVWIAVTKILSRGPEITIVFSSADGLEANKTKVNYNGLDVGTLTAIRLADDHHHVIATAAMVPKSKDFLVKDTEFWVVKPRISGLNISGLGTLLSGYYIGVKLGQSQESERNFVALETPPFSGDISGRFFTLRTPELGSLGNGAPIYFRHLPAGQVVSYQLDEAGDSMTVKIFVQAPYDKFVAADTRFWQASGIDLSLSADGLHVQTESLMTILAGGVAFETPASDSTQPPAAADTVFTLYADRTDAFRPPEKDPQKYLLVFRQSVRGLAVGAPVELGGVTIGEVTDINPEFNMQTSDFSVPVTIRIDPVRFGVKFLDMPAGEDPVTRRKRVINTLVARGLRAQLKTGSMLSGSLFVAVDFFPDAPPVSLDWSQGIVQLPTTAGQIDALEGKIEDIVKQLDEMQFKQISADLRKAIGDLDTTLVSAHGTLTNTDQLMGSANQLVGSANKLIEPNSVLDTELDTMLLQGGDAARALRVLLDYLERHPEALVRGKTGDSK
jgi:paraquat-inducible protein B